MRRQLIDAIVVTAIAAGAVLAAFYSGRAEAQVVGLHQGLVGVHVSLCLQVGGVRLFRGIKPSEVHNLSVHLYSRTRPPVCDGYTKQAAKVSGLGVAQVLAVLRVRGGAQVGPPVVIAHAVDVVDLVWRPFARHVQPCQAVNEVKTLVNSCDQVALTVCAPGYFPCLVAAPVAGLETSSEEAGNRVVVESVPQAFGGEMIGISHDAGPLQSGQVSAGVGSAKRAPLSYGVNLVTAHTGGGYRWDTPGLYVRRDDGLTLGALRNSLGRTSFHASQTWERGPWAVQAGAITGYPMAPVVPLLTGSVLISGHHRLVLIPGPRNRMALHLAVEWK